MNGNPLLVENGERRGGEVRSHKVVIENREKEIERLVKADRHNAKEWAEAANTYERELVRRGKEIEDLRAEVDRLQQESNKRGQLLAERGFCSRCGDNAIPNDCYCVSCTKLWAPLPDYLKSEVE